MDLSWVADQCPHFSGADCRNIIANASYCAVEELKKWRKQKLMLLQLQEKQTEANLRQNHTVEMDSVEEDAKDDRLLFPTSCAANNNEVSNPNYYNKTAVEGFAADFNEPMNTEVEKSFDISESYRETDITNNTLLTNPLRCLPPVLTFELTSPVGGASLQSTVTIDNSTLVEPTAGLREGRSEFTLEDPFSEGEYLVYARHFIAALKLVQPSVTEKVTSKLRSTYIV